jgi:hypothetical protein
VGEIKSQVVRSHKGTRLVHVVAQDISQRRMKQVGRSMVSHNRLAAGDIDVRLHAAANTRSDRRLQNMDVHISALLRVKDSDAIALNRYFPLVSKLASGLTVERCLIQNEETSCCRQNRAF